MFLERFMVFNRPSQNEVLLTECLKRLEDQRNRLSEQVVLSEPKPKKSTEDLFEGSRVSLPGIKRQDKRLTVNCRGVLVLRQGLA